MAKIKIGKNFKAEFDAIVAMFGGGYISGDVKIRSASGGEIVTDVNAFEYSDEFDGTSGSTGKGETLRIDKSGASWFGVLRGKKADTSSAEWQQLIESVAADYHRNFSFLEYKMHVGEETVRAQNRFADKAARLMEDLFPAIKPLKAVRTGTLVEDVYGLNLRLYLGGGMGEAQPVLCKVFFIGREDDENGKLRPLGLAEAERVDAQFSVMPDEDGSTDFSSVDRSVVDKVFGAFEELIEADETGDNCFSDYVQFGTGKAGDDRDVSEVKKLLDQLANSEVKTLTCSGVNVLGISHIKWQNAVFSIMHDGAEPLSVIVGLNGSISVNCRNCSESGEPLIVNNGVALYGGGTIVLDPQEDGFGLTDEDKAILREQSAIGEHLMVIRCPDGGKNEVMSEPCSRIKCKSQFVTVGGVEKCADCPHPEIVYKDIYSVSSAVARHTADLGFAHDAEVRDLVEESALKTCSCCKRKFRSGGLSGGLCEVCRGKKRPAAYSDYKFMLSPMKRLRYVFTRKACYEDDDILVFIMGNDRYVFRKDSVPAGGYIDGPDRAKRS